MVKRAVIVLALVARSVAADPSTTLRESNIAATAGEWAKVASLVNPLLVGQLAQPDLAEAHRLAGLAAFFLQRQPEAEAHFLAYLRIDLDGHLDPALYPPEVITFFNDVKSKHQAELRARRPQPKRYFILNFVPPLGQFQNGDRVKGIVVGSLLGAFAVANVTSYFVLDSWCKHVTGPSGENTVTCDDPKDHNHAAGQLRALNIVAGVGLIATYLYGVYDGVRIYRRNTELSPYLTPIPNGGMLGLGGRF
jgi:hypothetical protein